VKLNAGAGTPNSFDIDPFNISISLNGPAVEKAFKETAK
jgi:hypothetical protein